MVGPGDSSNTRIRDAGPQHAEQSSLRFTEVGAGGASKTGLLDLGSGQALEALQQQFTALAARVTTLEGHWHMEQKMQTLTTELAAAHARIAELEAQVHTKEQLNTSAAQTGAFIE